MGYGEPRPFDHSAAPQAACSTAPSSIPQSWRHAAIRHQCKHTRAWMWRGILPCFQRSSRQPSRRSRPTDHCTDHCTAAATAAGVVPPPPVEECGQSRGHISFIQGQEFYKPQPWFIASISTGRETARTRRLSRLPAAQAVLLCFCGAHPAAQGDARPSQTRSAPPAHGRAPQHNALMPQCLPLLLVHGSRRSQRRPATAWRHVVPGAMPVEACSARLQ